MKYLRAIGAAMTWAALAAWGWVVSQGTALAAPVPVPADTGEGASNSYALPYAVVILTVILGLLVVLRSSGRRDREKPEEYRSKEEMLSRD